MGNRYYIWGDDAIWKLPIKLLQSNMDPRELLTNGGRQVTNLIYATLFTEEEKKTLERVDLAHPDNAEISFEFRKVKMN